MKINPKSKLVLLAISLVGILIIAVGCNAPASTEKEPVENGYKDGTYEGVGTGIHGEVKVEVKVEGGKIADVTVVSHSETEGVGTVAVEKLPGEIIQAQSTEVEAVTGASLTSKAIIDGVNEALQGAK